MDVVTQLTTIFLVSFGSIPLSILAGWGLMELMLQSMQRYRTESKD